MTNAVVGMVTCASRTEARKVAKTIVTKKLAACVNVVVGLESHYWWRGKIESARECLLLVKTTRARARAVEGAVRAAHSYEVPEIVFLPVVAGEGRYMKWLRASVSKIVAAILVFACVGAARADQIDDLIKQLGSTNDEDRAVAADGLAHIGGERVVKEFREMLKSPGAERRQMAVVGLLQVSNADEDVERVHACLKDDDSTVRWSAVVALQNSRRTDAIPWLEDTAKNDAADSVREAATEAVGKLRSGIRWVPTLDEAEKKSRQLKNPVLAYFFLRDSDYCQKLEDGVLADKSVVAAAEEFVCVRLDAVKDADAARKLDVRGAPTILFLDGEGNEMSRVAGLVDKDQFLTKLSEAKRSKLTFREARRLAMQNPADVQANWKVAETYLEEGNENLAEPHLRNVIAHDEDNQYGYTDKAMFALGFALGKRGEYSQAAYSFEKLLERWPDYKDKDKVLYCLGLSQLVIGQKDKGRARLEQLVKEFPNSSTAASAQAALDKLNKKEGKNETGN
ncbi:MAG TPA: divalent cation tolerance protein CutA [Verrucomicrobiae bacterium]|nr:divalent cation tolerance protein CutA [Verrucomicrobiae bacterium]